MKPIHMKVPILVGLMILSTLVWSQNAKRKSVKFETLEYPAVGISNINSYKLSIYPNGIDLDQNKLKLKKGLGSKMQNLQDQMNNQTGLQYFTFKDIQLNPTHPDVHIDIAFGDFVIRNKSMKDHNIPCKHEGAKLTKENIMECPAFYYVIDYELPTILRVKHKNGEVLYAERMIQGSTDFGYDKSGLSGYLKTSDLEKAFNQPGTKTGLATGAIIDRLDAFEQVVNQMIYFYRIPHKFDIATASDKEFDYSALDKAQEKAVAGYESIESENGQKLLAEAIDIWEKEMAQHDSDDKKARINNRVALAIGENLAYAYLVLHKNEKALNAINKTLTVQGLVANKSREPEYQDLRNLILSMKVMGTGYESNKDQVKGTPKPVGIILQELRVKEKNAPYEFISPEKNFAEFVRDYETFAGARSAKKEAVAEASMADARSNYEARMQKTTAGNVIVLMGLTGDNFETLPAEICNLNLSQLTASGIKDFKTLPPEIINLSNLKKLMISGNQLAALPAEIGSLSNLEVLNVSNNNLSSLPAEIKNLKNLKKLNVKGNNIPAKEINAIQAAIPNCKIKQ